MTQAAFDLLARPIQQSLWDMRWEALRPIQTKTIECILRGNRDIIVSARTAAGKTEAAFLPILSILCHRQYPSIQAMYVGPLKALINDQFRRLDELCQRAEIPVHRWHGDVDAEKKRKLLDDPRGVLLITPESIESLFINHSETVSRLFRHLEFAVLDELHAFVGRERGTHLRSLLFRIRRFTTSDFRFVGLSATLGDGLPKYCEWIRPGESDRVELVHDPGEQKQILFQICAAQNTELHDRLRQPDEIGIPDQLIQNIHSAFSGKKNLIFANSRENVESYADALNTRCRQIGSPPEFLVHHGSLSKEIREHTECLMRRDRPYTTLCSSTLELGIDIGHVAAVGQLGAPWSVNSLVQRLGRGGRKEGEPQVMRLYLVEKSLGSKDDLVDRLRPELLRAVALTELMLQRWVESPQIDEIDLSTLVQQVLSVLAQTGGVKAVSLFQILVQEGAFRELEQRMFVEVLRSLGNADILEQVPGGDLILSPKGEAIVRHYSFYSAFATPVEYGVVFDGRTIGQLPALHVPREGEHLLLGGRRWEVIQIDDRARIILVKTAQGRKPPRFTGDVGEIHPRVRETMRDVLLGDKHFSYLDFNAMAFLQQARSEATSASLRSRCFVELSGSRCLWFTWAGTRVQRTLCLMAKLFKIEAIDEDIAIQFSAPVVDVVAAYRNLLARPPTAHSLAQAMRSKFVRKFDELLAEPLLVESLAHDAIDLSAACSIIHSAINSKVNS